LTSHKDIPVMGSVILAGASILGLATVIAVSAGCCQTQSWEYNHHQADVAINFSRYILFDLLPVRS
jgi:hypothetical protein